VVFILNICLLWLTKLKTLVNVKAVVRLLVLSFFIFGQIGTTAHAHGHEHSEDEHKNACAFCILAVNEDDISAEDFDLPDILDGPSFLKSASVSNIGQTEGRNIGVHFLLYVQLELRPPHILLDAARAPPCFQNLS